MNTHIHFSNSCRRRIVACFIYFIVVMFFFISSASAHKVSIFAWVEGDTVYTESKFSGGKKVKNAPVEVYDARGNKLLEGKTDESGEFSFNVPQKTEMKIVLSAGMGHRAEWTISADEVMGADASGVETGVQEPGPVNSVPVNPVKTEVTEATEPATLVTDVSLPCMSSDDIEKAVEKALEKRLNPIVAKLNKSLNPDHDPTFTDILGGIGYILGLIGIGTYFNYRKKGRMSK